MVKLVNQTTFAAKIKGKKLYIFSANDIRRLFGVSTVAASALLHRYKKRGFILQLKRKFYVFRTLCHQMFTLLTNYIVRHTYRLNLRCLIMGLSRRQYMRSLQLPPKPLVDLKL